MGEAAPRLQDLVEQASDLRAPAARAEVEPAEGKNRRSLYKKREPIYPKLARGRFRRIKWIVLIAALAVYYLLPWLRWERGPGQPDQAVLLDLPGRRFYFFFIEIWPQEIYYLTGLLILAAIALFLITAIAGRVWCGYACPQTVWTDLFLLVEHWIEGDRAARIRLDKKPWGAAKLVRKVAKHAAWLLIAMLTGGAWVFYFADAPTLAGDLLAFDAPTVAYAFVGILTFTTYWLAGHMREQVCTYMCPWPRIQGAMLDEDSLVVTYRDYRGEPRGPMRKGEAAAKLGDCIDCKQCVVVCPMGIDIRNGQQMECITCALCIDACDDVMTRVGRPRGLIAYDTIGNLERRAHGQAGRFRLIRPRTLLYGAIILLVLGVMLFAFSTRSTLEVNLLRDRNPLFVTLSDGSIRNGYTVKLLNKSNQPVRLSLSIEGLPGALVTLVGGEEADALSVPADQLRALRVFVAAPPDSLKGPATDIDFVLTDPTGAALRQTTVFRGP